MSIVPSRFPSSVEKQFATDDIQALTDAPSLTGFGKYFHFKVDLDVSGNRGEINCEAEAVKSDAISRYRYLHRHMMLGPGLRD